MAEEYKRTGWYPDPDGVPGERWWNGSGWSDSRRGAAPPAGASSHATSPPAPPVIYSAQNPAPQRPDPYGAATTPSLSQAPGRRLPTSLSTSVNRNAMIGFVTGLIALFFNVLFVIAPIAIVFSVLGIRRANELKAQGAPSTLMIFALIGLGSGIIAGFIGLISMIAFIVPIIQITSVQ